MKAARYLFLSVALAALFIPLTLCAESGKPSFDCSKAESDAEKLVCSDEQLALLDRELARIYKLASNNPTLDAKGKKYLRASQRGWIKGRDEAWKVKDKKRYVTDLYLMRIAEIRYQSSAAGDADKTGLSSGPVEYDCGSEQMHAFFIATDPPAAVIKRASSLLVVKSSSSASGPKYVGDYADGRVEFWSKGKEAILSIANGKEFRCTLK